MPSNELFQGGTATGNICWAVPATDSAALVMTVEASFGFDSDKLFFAL